MSPSNVQFHATKQLILDVMLALLEVENPGTITSDQVLAKARVSSGSLYHHFDDYSDLLEQALCIKYEEFIDRTVDLLVMAQDQATSLTEWAEGVNAAREISHGPAYARIRALRVWAVAYATTSDRMRTRLGKTQDRLNTKFTNYVKDAQKAGWVLPEKDPLIISVFIQAYHFGAVIDDIALTTHFDPKTWVDTLDMVIKKSFVKFD